MAAIPYFSVCVWKTMMELVPTLNYCPRNTQSCLCSGKSWSLYYGCCDSVKSFECQVRIQDFVSMKSWWCWWFPIRSSPLWSQWPAAQHPDSFHRWMNMVTREAQRQSDSSSYSNIHRQEIRSNTAVAADRVPRLLPTSMASSQERIQGDLRARAPCPQDFFRIMQLSGNFKGKRLYWADFGLRAPLGAETPLGPPDQNPGSAPASSAAADLVSMWHCFLCN